MTQTFAIFLDAYRALNSNRLFWIALWISVLIVVAFACLGLNDRGYSIFFWQVDDPFLNSHNIPPDQLYKRIFKFYAVKVWFSWAAAILALISTAGIFPDLLTQGSIDVFVSKPLSRLRLFLTMYAAGLLFVAVQILLFTIASFFVLGIRAGTWIPAIFLAVPILICFYSYLFSVCVFVGVWTRSTMISLLLTLLFWGFIFVVDQAEQSLLAVANANNRGVSIFQFDPQADTRKFPNAAENKSHQFNWIDTLHRITFGLKTVLPKTGETVALLDRHLLDVNDLVKDATRGTTSSRPDLHAVDVATETEIYNRPVSWVIGTSLGFECVVLALAAWLFCRRDY